MKEPMNIEVFRELVISIKSDFKKCTKWLDWYLHKDRGKLIFRAIADEPFISDCHNTNAEESMGHSIQMSCEHDNSTFVQMYFHWFQWATKMDFEYTCAIADEPTRYGKPRAKRSCTNDGRAPDTNVSIFGNN